MEVDFYILYFIFYHILFIGINTTTNILIPSPVAMHQEAERLQFGEELDDKYLLSRSQRVVVFPFS